MRQPARGSSLRPHALKRSGFTSFKRRPYAYFSSFARATQYSIGLEPIFSLGGCLPPVFALHSQAVLLFQQAPADNQDFAVFARPLWGSSSAGNARPQRLAASGLAPASSLAATSAISF